MGCGCGGGSSTSTKKFKYRTKSGTTSTQEYGSYADANIALARTGEKGAVFEVQPASV
jgi:hypothetical protein